MNYKLLVLDLDGTLTNSKKEITPFTRETLLQAQEKGLHLVLASGRPTYGIVPLAEELNIKQYGGFILLVTGPEHAINYFESHSKLIQNILHIIYM